MSSVQRFFGEKRKGINAAIASGVVTLIAIIFVVASNQFTTFELFVSGWIFIGGGVALYRAACRSEQKALIEISSSEIRFRDYFSVDFTVLSLEEVKGLEWPGGDNVGLQLHSGEVVSISVAQLPQSQQDKARVAIRDAVERAT